MTCYGDILRQRYAILLSVLCNAHKKKSLYVILIQTDIVYLNTGESTHARNFHYIYVYI